MITAALISLAMQAHAAGRDEERRERFHFADLGAMTPSQVSFFNHLADWLPCQMQLIEQHAILSLISEVAAEVDNRLKTKYALSSLDQPGRHPEESVYLILHGLQHARDLPTTVPHELSPLGEPAEIADPAQQLITILREGPDVGVYTLAWCDTVADLTDSLDQVAQRQFAMRVALQMSPEDSNWLIETPAASELRPSWALFYDRRVGHLERFRPYSLPSESWLEWVRKQIRPKRK